MRLSRNITVLFVFVTASIYIQAQETNRGTTAIPGEPDAGWPSVTGIITDAATGKPLTGINVSYRDKTASISLSNGIFTLQVPSTDATILVEGDGYQSKEVALKGRSKDIRISLYEDTYNSVYNQGALPYGSIMRHKSPFAVSSIKTNGNWGIITETPSSYLQGRVAGLHAIRRSGTPNIGATMFLRGISSLYATNQPLIVVDGVLFNNQDQGGSLISNHYTDPLSTIDVRDIDNITVLKDGSSIYGTKGANGVIIITTARARELGTRIDFAVTGGVNFKPSTLPMLKAADYRIYLSEMLKSKGLTEPQIQVLPYMNDDPNHPDYYRYHNNTNWQDQVVENSSTKNIFLKVTGGDNIAKYALSLGFMDNAGVTRNTGMKRYNMRFNGDFNMSRRLTATTNLSFTFNEQQVRDQGTMPKTNPLFVALIKSPLLRAREVSDKGVESPSYADRDTFDIGNPLILTDVAQGLNKSYRFLGSIGFNYAISKSWSASTVVGVTNDKVRENFFVPRKGVTSDTLTTDIAFSRLGTQVTSLFSIYNDTRLTFSQRINNVHDLSSRLGVRYMFNKTEQDFGLGFNSAIDELVSVGNGVNNLRRIGGVAGESNWLSTYFNTDYSYRDRYFVSLNIAIDGSSRFGRQVPDAFTVNGNKYAVLPSLAAAWLISSEKFVKGDLFDLLKLRASIGMAGNDDIGNYTARQTYVSQNLLGVQGLVRGGFGNNELQWEKNRKINIGIDAALLKERLSISIDAYQNRTSKMISYEAAPNAAGFDYLIVNFARQRTKGIEAAVNGRIINKTSLKWDAGATFGHYKSTIIKLPDDDILTTFADATYITRPGSTPNLFWGHKTNGVYASDAEAAQDGLSVRRADGTLAPFRGGDMRFADLNNDNIIDNNDRKVIGDPNPDFVGSFINTVTYKQFSLDVLCTFVKGIDVYNYTRRQLEAMSGYANQTEAVLNRWRSNGHQTHVPRATWGDPMGNSRFSDRWLEDGSYFRLRTVTLTYNIRVKSEFMKYAVVYLTGNNLLTLTKYKGFDPEFSPTESIYGQGVDNTLEPQYRSFQLGVRIGL